jgi:hypothetical protein
MKFYRNVMFMIQRAGYATKATNITRSTPQRLRWTTKESDLLMQLVDKYGKHWAHLETFFESRSASMLSGRYHYLEKKGTRSWNDKNKC